MRDSDDRPMNDKVPYGATTPSSIKSSQAGLVSKLRTIGSVKNNFGSPSDNTASMPGAVSSLKKQVRPIDC